MAFDVSGKNCRDCGWYKDYYIKGNCRFERLKNGLCVRSGHAVDGTRQACSSWKHKPTKEFVHKTVSMMKLEQIAEDISAVRQILEESTEK